MKYRAIAYARTTGEILRDEIVEIAPVELYSLQGTSGALAFHQLINRWNRHSLLSLSGPINVYTVEP